METNIGEVKGYTITYDSRDKLFRLKNAEGEEVGSGKTQDEVEQQADKLSKQGFTFPIPALLAGSWHIDKGKVTSVNLGDRSATFIYHDKADYRSRAKIHLRTSHAHELTPKNEQIYQEVVQREEQVLKLHKEIEQFTKELENPINLSYFGLKEGFY